MIINIEGGRFQFARKSSHAFLVLGMWISGRRSWSISKPVNINLPNRMPVFGGASPRDWGRMP